MKKFLILILLLLIFAPASSAQSRYTIDNFDLNLVQVKPEPTPTPKPVVAKDEKGKKGKKAEQQHPQQQQPAMLMALKKELDGYTTGNSQIDTYIVESARKYNLDPVLIYATMHQESSFNQKAISPKGARGLMQLMPATAVRLGVTNIFDPKQNIEGGAKYLRMLLDMFNGDVRLALAGYNAGEGAVIKYGYTIPPYNETQEYVRRITKRYEMMRNPQYALTAKQMTAKQATAAQKIVPLALYERDVTVVKLPDGRTMLVSQ
jgi:soluble lytic murein transglycosylase-like protein